MSEEFSLGLQLELDPNAISKIQENVKSIKIEPIQVTLDFKTANNQIKGLQSALKSLSTMKFDVGGQSGGSSNIESKTKAVSQTYKELISLQRQINGKQLKITSLDSQLDSKKILQYYQDIQKLKKAINDLGGAKALQGKELINFESLQSSTAVLDTVTNKVHQAEEAFKGSFNSSKMTQEISAIESKMNSLSTVSETTRSKFSELKTAQDALNQSLADKSSIGTVVDNQARYNQILEETKASLKQDIDLEKQRIQQQRELAAATKLEAGRKDLSNQMAIWLKNNSAAAADFGGRIKQLQTELQNCDAVRLNGIKGEFKSIQQEAVLAGKTGQSLTEQIGSIGRAITTYFSAFKIITQAIRYLKEMYHNVYDINTAMTELKKVTEETESTYSNYFANAKEDAGEVSATISEYITATSNYARLGYNVPDSSELAKTALLYNNVGDDIQDVDDATESLISTMKGFNMEANESMQIVDKANDVGNNFAISSGGIGVALEKSAASLSVANNSLDESIGLITAANTIVQNPEIVGTAFKTLTMRIRGAESELEEAGLDAEGMTTSVSKLRAEIKALSGVDIMLNDQTFKSTYQILKELSDVWDNLSDITQANILEKIAGKRQGNIIAGLMKNFDIAESAKETSANSSGSAMAEYNKWLDSMEAHTQHLKLNFESLSQSFMNSESLNKGIDVISGFINVLDKLISTLGAIPTVAGLAAAALTFKKGGGVGELINQFHYYTHNNEYAHEIFN